MNTTLIICLSVCFCIACICIVIYLLKNQENELKLYDLESANINDRVYQLLNSMELKYMPDYDKKTILKCLHLLDEDYIELIEEN